MLIDGADFVLLSHMGQLSHKKQWILYRRDGGRRGKACCDKLFMVEGKKQI